LNPSVEPPPSSPITCSTGQEARDTDGNGIADERVPI